MQKLKLNHEYWNQVVENEFTDLQTALQKLKLNHEYWNDFSVISGLDIYIYVAKAKALSWVLKQHQTPLKQSKDKLLQKLKLYHEYWNWNTL